MCSRGLRIPGYAIFSGRSNDGRLEFCLWKNALPHSYLIILVPAQSPPTLASSCFPSPSHGLPPRIRLRTRSATTIAPIN